MREHVGHRQAGVVHQPQRAAELVAPHAVRQLEALLPETAGPLQGAGRPGGDRRHPGVADESQHVRPGLDRLEVAVEDVDHLGPEPQRPGGQPERLVVQVLQLAARVQPVEPGLAFGVVDRTPVVRVDQRQVDQAATLVGVGHPGQGELDQLLRQGDRTDGGPVGPDGGADPLGHLRLPGELAGQVVHALLVVEVGFLPTAVHLRLAHRLGQVLPQPLRTRPSDAHQGLPQQMRGGPVDAVGVGRLGGRPGTGRPGVRIARDRQQPGPDVRGPLGVVGRQRGQAVQPVVGVVAGPLVQGGDAGFAAAGRVGAHLVERGQPVPAVEGGVLDALGHHRSGGLLEPDAQVDRGRPVAGGGAGVEQDAAERGQLAGQVGTGGDRGADRAGERSQQGGILLGRGQVGTDVGPVDVDGDQQFDHGLGEPAGIEVGQRLLGPAHQPADLGDQQLGDHLALRGVHLDGEVGFAAGGPPGTVEFVHRARVDQGQAERRVGVVAGGAGTGPGERQPLVRLQDLLDPDRGARPAAVGELGEIADRVGQAVGMVDPEAVHQPGVMQLEQQRMGVGEHVRLFHPDADQPVHLEEPAVVEHLGVAPPGQLPVLRPEQSGQPGALRVGPVRPQRQHVLVIADDRSPGRGALVLAPHVDGELAGLDHLVQRGTEDGQAEPSVQMVPVHVEPVGVRRAGALGEHVPQRGVAPQRSHQRHVVGHHVDDQPHRALMAGVREPFQTAPSTQLGIDAAVVEHVVAVRRSRHRGQDRRQIHVADAERVQVGQHGGRLFEGESAVQLQPVGGRERPHGRGDTGRGHPATLSQSASRGPGRSAGPSGRRWGTQYFGLPALAWGPSAETASLRPQSNPTELGWVPKSLGGASARHVSPCEKFSW